MNIIGREILFRGEILGYEEGEFENLNHENGWVYGGLTGDETNPMIIEEVVEVDSEGVLSEQREIPVHPDSVGQFTGRYDKDGKRVFEGDYYENPHGDVFVIKWNKELLIFDAKHPGTAHSEEFDLTPDSETGCLKGRVIGNTTNHMVDLMEGEICDKSRYNL